MWNQEAPIATRTLSELSELSASPAVGDLFLVLDVSDTSESASGTTKKITHQNLLSALDTEISTHVADVANPHAVTKTQVGLGNVDNTSDATKNTAVATLTNKTLTAPQIGGDADLDDATGNITVAGADPKRGLYIPASALFPATTNGCGALAQIESSTNKINAKYLPFDGASEEYAWFGPIQAPDYWDLGTLTMKFHYRLASGSGDVVWGVAALCSGDGDTEDVALGTAVTVTDTAPNATTERTTPATSAITPAGTPAKGDLLYIRVYRDADAAGDTADGIDAYLKGITVKFGIGQYNDA